MSEHDEDREHDDRPPHPAAAAVNWRTVLAADALVGLVPLLAGLAMVAWWSVVVGAGIASLGFAYLALVWRRARLWSAWRHRAGLD